jgi:hypothetical protein
VKKVILLFILSFVFLSIPSIAYGASLIIRPNGDAGTNQWSRIGAGSIHYTAVDEATGSDTDYVYEYVLNEKDEWTMQDVSGTIPSYALIDSVVLTERGKCGNSSEGREAGLKIGSDYTWGPQRTNTTTFSDSSYKLSAPGGRTWSRANLDSLVVSVIKSKYNADVNVYTSQAYATVYYNASVENTLRPAGDAYLVSGEWYAYPTDSSRYQTINESTSNGDVDYIWEDLTSKKYIWNPTDWTGTGSIDSVRMYWEARQTVSGTAKVIIGRAYNNSGTFTWCGARDTVTLTTSYATYNKKWNLDPYNDNAWSSTYLNDNNYGFGIESQTLSSTQADSFGRTTGASALRITINYMSAYKFQATYTGRVDTLAINCVHMGVNNCRMALYADSGNGSRPREILDSVVQFTPATGWNRVPLYNGNVSVTANTYYWICFRMSATMDTVRYDALTNGGRYRSLTYANAWPSPAATTNDDAKSFSLLAIGKDAINARATQSYITVYYTDITPPATVTLVDTTAVTTTSVSLKCHKNDSTDCVGYQVRYNAGSTPPDSVTQGTYGDSSDANGINDTLFTVSNLQVDSQYSFSIFAKDDVPNWTTRGSGSYKTRYTKANTPSAPTVAEPTCNTMKVTVNKNGNPTRTQFAVRESTAVGGGNYVQVNGTLGGTAVWQDSATWGTKRVTGLSASTTYYFKTKARNWDSLETAFGSPASQTTSAQSASACTVYVVADSSPLQWSKYPAGSANHYSLVDDPAGSPDNASTYTYTTTDSYFDWFVPDSFQINCIPDNRVIDSVVVKRRTRCTGGIPPNGEATMTYLKNGSDSASSGNELLNCQTGAWTNSSWSTTTHPSGSAWTKTSLKSTILGIESSFEDAGYTLYCTQIYYIVYHSAVSLGISANPTSWDLDTLNPSQIKTMVTGEKIKVTNTGNVAEQLSLKISTMDTKGEWSCSSLASGQGVNKYVMSGVFRHKDSTVTSSNFNAPSGSADVIDTLIQWASSDTFAVGTQAVGASLARSDSLYFWLQMKMPTTASGPKADSSRNVIIQIGCQQAP